MCHSEGEPALCLSLRSASSANPRKELIASTHQDPELMFPKNVLIQKVISVYSPATALWACFEKSGLTKSNIQQLLFFVSDIT